VTVADAGKYAVEVVIKGSPITTYLQRNIHLAVSGKCLGTRHKASKNTEIHLFDLWRNTYYY
jgi:hypothetical protein